MFHLPNLITASNLLCGVLAIISSLMGRIDLAPFFIYAGAIFDFFDGFLARKMNKMGELGKQLDSLADMVTFGVAPGIFMFVVLIVSIQATTFNNLSTSEINDFLTNWKNCVFYDVPNLKMQTTKYIPFFALFIPFISIFRLAKFNIDTRQSESFIGLNTPTNTIFFSVFPLILFLETSNDSITYSISLFIFKPYFLIPLIATMSLLLIAEIPMFSLKFKTFKWHHNELKFSFLITCLLLILFLLVWSIPIIVILYVILSLIDNKIKSKSHEIQS